MQHKTITSAALIMFLLAGCSTTPKNVNEALKSNPVNDIAIVFIEPEHPIVQEIYYNYGGGGGLLGGLIAVGINHARAADAQAEVKPFLKAVKDINPYREMFTSLQNRQQPLEWATVSEYHYLEYKEDFNFPQFVEDNINAEVIVAIEPQLQFPQRYEVLEAAARLSILKRNNAESRLYSNYVTFQSRIYDVYKDIERTPEFNQNLAQINDYKEKILSKEGELNKEEHMKVCRAVSRLEGDTVEFGKPNPKGRMWLADEGDAIRTFVDESITALPNLIFIELNDRDDRRDHQIMPVKSFSRVGGGFGSTVSVEPGYELHNDGDRHVIRTYRDDDKDMLWSKRIEYPLLSKKARWYPFESLIDKDDQLAAQSDQTQ